MMQRALRKVVHLPTPRRQVSWSPISASRADPRDDRAQAGRRGTVRVTPDASIHPGQHSSTRVLEGRDSVYRGCNQAFAADLGLNDPAEIVGKCDFDLDVTVMADLYRADDKLVIEQGSPKLNYTSCAGPTEACGPD